LGKVAAARGELDLADEYLRRSHVGLEAEGDRYDAAWSRALRAQAIADLGDTDRALALLDEAFARMKSTGSVFGQAGLVEIYGRIQQAIGHESEARDATRRQWSSSRRATRSRRGVSAFACPESLDAESEPTTAKWRL
jgi:tetratricopeptide (TPR) repeat protein